MLYIPGETLSGCLDAVRYLADPSAKHLAHITVRGPCAEPIATEPLNRQLAGNLITLAGVDSFRGDRQQTVFLGCDGTRLRRVWAKRDYGYHPHITLYDGEDPAFAEALLAVAGRYRFNSPFRCDRLVELTSFRGLPDPALAARFDTALRPLVARVTGWELGAAEVGSLPASQRLHLIDRLLEHLSAHSPPV